MIVDGASSRVAKALLVPENIRHHRLPAYSPQLNPQEDLWDELRENEFPNRVCADMAGVLRQLEQGLPRLAADTERVRSIAAWPWIAGLLLNAKEHKERKPRGPAHLPLLQEFIEPEPVKACPEAWRRIGEPFRQAQGPEPAEGEVTDRLDYEPRRGGGSRAGPVPGGRCSPRSQSR